MIRVQTIRGKVRHAAGFATVLAVTGLVWLSGRTAPRDPLLLSLRIAPNPVPAGTGEIVIGSVHELPEAFGISSLSSTVTIDQVERVGSRAMKIRLRGGDGGEEVAFRVATADDAVVVPVSVSRNPAILAVPANLPDEALETRALTTPRPIFTYAFRPMEGVDLAGVCLLNETTGVWSQRDIEKATEPRTGTDEPGSVRPDFLGVRLVPGRNEIRIATFSRDGAASLEALTVEYRVPEEEA